MLENLKTTLAIALTSISVWVAVFDTATPVQLAFGSATTYRQASPESTADWLWWQAVWWLLPIAGVVMIIIMLRGGKPGKEQKVGSREKREYEQWRLDRMVGGTVPPPAKTPEPDEKSAVRWLTLADAVKRSGERKWIVGQACERQPNRESSQKAVGELLTVDYQTANFAILGGVGGGKTSSTGMIMLMYAKRFGLHPVVLDGKDGLDWGPLGDTGIVEWHSMTPENIGGFIDQLNRIYRERHAIMRRVGVGKIYDLPKAQRPLPLFVIMEEFGRTWAKADRNRALENGFNDLFCLGRAAGIILCPIDQAPEEWSRSMRANAKFAVCYSAQGDALKAFGEHYIAEMPQTGVFSKSNVFYRAWHTAALYDMRRLPKIQQRFLVEPKVELAGTASSTVPAQNEPVQVVEQSGTAGTLELELEPLVKVPPSVQFQFQSSTGNKWGKFCAAMFQHYPSLTQDQLQAAMATVAGGDADAYKSRAFRGYHRFSQRGDKAKVQNYMEVAA